VRGRLAAFRGELYRCQTAWADELFELTDALLCADGPVRDLAGLSLVPGTALVKSQAASSRRFSYAVR
jgi:hypothetical protein